MKNFLILTLLLLCLNAFSSPNANTVERWNRFAISLKGPQSGNPFTDVWLKAEFSNGSNQFTADGFYGGEGIYLLRFMPIL